jgi:4-amino-4-deoxychorismate lyase
MFPFFETIRYCNAVAENLLFHQQRVDRTFAHFEMTRQLDLLRFDFKTEAEKNGAILDCVYKCKITYDLNGNHFISFEPYQIREIKTFQFFDIGNNDYSLKFTDRTWIINASKSAGTDEVIFVQNGLIKDATYANIVLFDGKDWVTPIYPLLFGTKRAFLLKENKIFEKEIHKEQLKGYKKLKLINAMMLWDESPTIDLE